MSTTLESVKVAIDAVQQSRTELADLIKAIMVKLHQQEKKAHSLVEVIDALAESESSLASLVADELAAVREDAIEAEAFASLLVVMARRQLKVDHDRMSTGKDSMDVFLPLAENGYYTEKIAERLRAEALQALGKCKAEEDDPAGESRRRDRGLLDDIARRSHEQYEADSMTAGQKEQRRIAQFGRRL